MPLKLLVTVLSVFSGSTYEYLTFSQFKGLIDCQRKHMNKDIRELDKITSLKRNLRNIQTACDKLCKDIIAITEQIRRLEIVLPSTQKRNPNQSRARYRKLTLDKYRNLICKRVKILNPNKIKLTLGE